MDSTCYNGYSCTESFCRENKKKPRGKWYINWQYCIMNCPSGSGSCCGGTAQQWDHIYNSVDSCCYHPHTHSEPRASDSYGTLRRNSTISFSCKKDKKVVPKNTLSHHCVELCILHQMMWGSILGNDIQPQTLYYLNAFIHACFLVVLHPKMYLPCR